MASLHTVTEETRKLTKWGGLTIAAIILLFFTFQFGGAVKEKFFPTPPQPPTVSFGKLPPISFPTNATDKKLTFILNTVSGTLPNLPDRATIYPIQKPQPSLLNLKRAEERAAAVGFLKTAEALSDTRYVWTETQPPFRKLILDIVTSEFQLLSNYLTSPDSILKTNPPDPASAINTATSFLSRLSLFPNDIDLSKTKTTLLSIQNQSMVVASSPSTAHLIRVDFFQKDKNSFPIYYPRPPQSTMYLILAGGRFDEQVVEAKFNHFNIEEPKATYPIKTGEFAFRELQEQKAYIASYFGEENTIHIKNVFLGYYLADSKTNYLMPIIVFEGDNGFFAYIQALTDSWIQTEPYQK
ncbi:MAG: hypothetical protein HYV39_02405 [Candidatus Levybacteria bacterium]|nr:hypothetical protein [Candidatus Levybacteria bacterium]